MLSSKEDRKEDGCMKHFISNHTPMGDYQRILQQGHYFRYYTRKVRRTIRWSDKLLNADKLLDALQALERRK